jgi:hypothetical protein
MLTAIAPLLYCCYCCCCCYVVSDQRPCLCPVWAHQCASRLSDADTVLAHAQQNDNVQSVQAVDSWYRSSLQYKRYQWRDNSIQHKLKTAAQQQSSVVDIVKVQVLTVTIQSSSGHLASSLDSFDFMPAAWYGQRTYNTHAAYIARCQLVQLLELVCIA